MALIRCPRCMQRISDTVEICPECEYKFTPEEIAKNKKTKEVKIGLLCICAFFVITFIVADLITRESTTTETRQEPTKSSTDTSKYSSQPEPPKTTKTKSPSVPVMSTPKPTEPPETEIQQEKIAANEAWLGTWSLEFINGEPTAKNLSSDLGSDIFVSWNYTFYADGRFESKLRQDTGTGIITTTASGTYEVSGNTYNTVLKEAIMSIGSASVSIPNITSYQSGTWSRTGDTLTMIPVGSSTKVFKRKY